MGSNLSPQIYALEADGNYQVNTIGDINNSYIGFKAGIDTLYTLTFTHQNKDPRYDHLYLMDLCENKTVEITAAGSKYCFNSGSNKEVENRFKIIATLEDLDINTDTNSVTTKTQPISVFNSDNIILIKNQSSLNGFLYFFDIAGRLLQKLPFQANGITTLTNQLPTGSYLIKAVTSEYVLDKKIIVQK